MAEEAPPPSRHVPLPQEEVYDTLCAVLFWHRLEQRRGRPGMPEQLVKTVEEACELIARLKQA